jgi:16S rRNA (adenine1518-N6/adenine1519-N6)-dimethyltransferase
MNLSSKKRLIQLLKRHRTWPKKGLGQHFLIEKRVFKKIIDSAQLSLRDLVLEIGPGIGNLTQELAKRVKKVIAVEKDPRMVEILKEVLRDFKNVEIIQGDILKIPNSEFKIQNFKIVANIPYYLTAPLIRKFLEFKNQPKLIVLLVQKEVAQRILSQPPKMNLLAISVQFYSQPEIISYVSKNSFWPKPQVESAIIRIIPRPIPFSKGLVENFFKIVKAGFSHPRKQLLNNLSQELKLKKKEVEDWLLKEKIQPNQRAETLSLEDWLSLTKSFKIKE